MNRIFTNLLFLAIMAFIGWAIVKSIMASRAENHVSKGVMYGEEEKYESAIGEFDKSIRLDPSNPKAFYNRGLAFYEMGKFPEAIADYSNAISLNPNYTIAYNMLGLAQLDSGLIDLAISNYTKAIGLGHRGALINSSGAYLEKGELELAIRDASIAIRLLPKEAMAYNNRGSAYGGKGQYDLAIADYEKALELDPELELARKNLDHVRSLIKH